MRNLPLAGSLDHFQSQLGLGAEHRFFRHMGASTQRSPLRIKPFLLQVKPPVQKGVRYARHGVAEEHANLAVFHLAQGSGVLPAHPTGENSLLAKPRIVDHEYPVVRPQQLGDHRLMFGHDGLFIPPGRDQKALQGPHATVPHLPGDRLGVLLVRIREKAPNISLRKNLHFFPSQMTAIAFQETPEPQDRLTQFRSRHHSSSRSLRGPEISWRIDPQNENRPEAKVS
jgi:hypothetical protein